MGTLSHLLKMDNSYSSQGSDATYEVDELEVHRYWLARGLINVLSCMLDPKGPLTSRKGATVP